MNVLEQKYPIIQELKKKQNTFWANENRKEKSDSLFSIKDVQEAENRLQRFAPYLEKAFPELQKTKGIIESPILPIPYMQKWLERQSDQKIKGRLWLKADHALPVAGSIKARGGIYEILTYAEKIALKSGLITEKDSYRAFGDPVFKKLFSSHHIIVGSTGNLGLSIGIISAEMGFHVTVHMSADAKEWKKALLREKGATVVEHKADYEKAVAKGREEAKRSPKAYFVDDEHSHTLFFGYATAALRLKKQLDESGITVDEHHPLYVYLPCGIGGGPGGVAYGLHLIFGSNVHCFFAEPTESPCMLLGLATGLHDQISVQDIGLTNGTEADGLAVGRASGFVGKLLESFLAGSYTVEDEQLFSMLAGLAQTEKIKLEPSALAGMFGPLILARHEQVKDRAVHLVWATGGSMVPDNIMEQYIEKGRSIPAAHMKREK